MFPIPLHRVEKPVLPLDLMAILKEFDLRLKYSSSLFHNLAVSKRQKHWKYLKLNWWCFPNCAFWAEENSNVFIWMSTEMCWRLSEFPLQCYQSAFKQHSPEWKLGNCILRFAWEEGFEIWQFDLNTDEFSIVCALELTNAGHVPFLLSVKISVRSWLFIVFCPDIRLENLFVFIHLNC